MSKIKIAGYVSKKHECNAYYQTDGIMPALRANGGGLTHGMAIKIPEATKQGYAVAEEGDGINLSVPNSKTRRGRVGKGVVNSLDTQLQQYTLQNKSIRRLTEIECEKLQGFPNNWTEGISSTQRYKSLGNAVSVPIVKMIMKKLFPTLKE